MHGVAKRWWSLVKAVTKRDFRLVLSGGSSQNVQPLVPLVYVSLSRLWMVVATGSLTPLALLQVVLVWRKLCLVGGSTWALACAAGQLVCLSTFSALWNVPKLDTWAPGQVGDRHHRLQVHRPPFQPFFKAAAAVQILHHRLWNQWKEGLWFSDTASDSQSRDTSAWWSIATCIAFHTCWVE